MIESEQIFQLMRTLNKGERRNLRVLINREGERDSPFFRLSRLIFKVEPFDGPALQRQLGCDASMLRKGMLRLYDLVMLARSVYVPERWETLGKRIGDIRYLISKGMRELALAVIAETTEECEREERFGELIRVLEIRLELTGGPPTTRDEIFRRLLEVDGQMQNLNSYLDLRRRVDQIRILSDQREHGLQIKALLGNPLLADEAECLSCRARAVRAEVLWRLRAFAFRFAEAVEPLREMLELIEEHPFVYDNPEYRLIEGRFMMGKIALAIGEPAEAASCFQRAMETETKDLTLEAKRFEEYCRLQLIYALETGKREAGDRAVGMLEEQLNRYEQSYSAGHIVRLKCYSALYLLFSEKPAKAVSVLVDLPKLSPDERYYRFQLYSLCLVALASVELNDEETFIAISARAQKILFSDDGRPGEEILRFTLKLAKEMHDTPFYQRRRVYSNALNAIPEFSKAETMEFMLNDYLIAKTEGISILEQLSRSYRRRKFGTG